MEGISLLFRAFIFLFIIMSIFRFSDNKTIRFYVTYYFYCLCVVVTCIIICPFVLFRPRNFNNLLLISRVFNVGQAFINIHWTVRNTHVMQKEQAAVLVANHQSIFDVMGMLQIGADLKGCTIVQKKEVLYYPIIGIVSWLCGFIFIDRKNPKEAVKTLRAACDLIISNKAKVWFFPEGTRGDGIKMLPFKKGAFMAAIQMQKPIIPVVFSPYYFIDFKNKTIEKDGHIILSVLEAIPTAGLTEKDVENLKEKTYKLMDAEFNKLSAAVKLPLT